MPVADYESLRQAGCKPLRDPVRTVALFMMAASLVSIVGAGSVLAALEKFNGAFFAVLLVCAAFGMALPTGLWLLLREPRTAILLVRTFRSDAASTRLQQVLRAGLGRSLRVCGIRSPRERPGVVLRTLAWGWSAFRYIGSAYHQLEAEDHDWRYRLMAWLPKARGAVLDLRDCSKHVESEARLCARAISIQRCLFITDGSRTPEEWAATIHALIADGGPPPLHLHVLTYDEASDERALVAQVRAFVTQLPEGRPVPAPEAVQEATAGADAAQVRTAFLETDLGQLVIGFAAGLALQVVIGFIALALGSAGTWFAYATSIPFLVLYALGVVRMWRMERLAVVTRPARTLSPRLRLVTSVVLVALGIAFQVFVPPALQRARQVAQEMLLSTQARSLAQSLILYENDHRGRFPARLEDLIGAGYLTRDDFDRAMLHPITKERPCFFYEQPRGGAASWDVADTTVILREVRGGRVAPDGVVAYLDGHVARSR